MYSLKYIYIKLEKNQICFENICDDHFLSNAQSSKNEKVEQW